MTTEVQILKFVTDQFGSKTVKDIALKLGEEAGEVQGAVMKADEGRATQEDIEAEIGDSLIVLSQLAAVCGKTLEDLRAQRWNAIKNREKPMQLLSLRDLMEEARPEARILPLKKALEPHEVLIELDAIHRDGTQDMDVKVACGNGFSIIKRLQVELSMAHRRALIAEIELSSVRERLEELK